MKKGFKKGLLLFVIATFLTASSAYAYHDGCEYQKHEKCDKFERLSDELGLTDEQKTRLDKQKEVFKEKNIAFMDKIYAKNKELKAELEKPEIDRESVNNIIDDIQKLTGEKLRNRVDNILAMKNILTQEQFEKLQQKMEKKRHGHKRRRR
ncbi:MAG: periplasmic heavy metal sensor [Candidatus Omnitrophica bacterium]|nr:periplasmic heavy metal sensor [Candidatus Omnitrophota bacterium]